MANKKEFIKGDTSFQVEEQTDFIVISQAEKEVEKVNPKYPDYSAEIYILFTLVAILFLSNIFLFVRISKLKK